MDTHHCSPLPGVQDTGRERAQSLAHLAHDVFVSLCHWPGSSGKVCSSLWVIEVDSAPGQNKTGLVSNRVGGWRDDSEDRVPAVIS